MIALDKYKLIVFDADGTLRRCTVPGQPTPNKPGEWELMPGVRETLMRINWTHKYLGVASNQAGVSLGFLTEDQALHLIFDVLDSVFVDLDDRKLPYGISVRICTHAPDAGCYCRKPMPGLLYMLMGYASASDSTLFVGDQESDRIAAERACCDFAWAKDFFGWE